MKKFTLKERFQYWFDTKMSKGSLGLIRILFVFSMLLILAVAGIITLLRLNPEQGAGETVWESFATVVNAWMPSSEDGPPGYIIMMAVSAIGGLFVTSVLIGILSSAIEEKLTSLRHGRSRILETGHTVILGFNPGEYTLISQLILSAAGRPATIVVAGDMESNEIREHIAENLSIPRNIQLICRQADIFDVAALERLMVSEARSVIINPADDRSTVKALLAVANIIHSDRNSSTRINAIIAGNEYRFPESIARRHNITTLQTNAVLAKMIAHSCTQCGLSQTFQELFNFEGSEFYLVDIPAAAGMTFMELMLNTNAGVPSGILRKGKITINPDPETLIGKDDRILVFAEDRFAPAFAADPVPEEEIDTAGWDDTEGGHTRQVTIIGFNKELRTVIRELPDNVTEITLAGLTKPQRKLVEEMTDRPEISVRFFRKHLTDEAAYRELAENTRHIAVLSDYEKSDEDADMEVIFHILYLRDIRARYDLDFNITAEMCLEQNESLVASGDNTDYIVTSNMSALFLAQLSESPELISVFMELLSNEGNELYIRRAGELHCTGTVTIRRIRQILLLQGCIFLGLLTEEGEGQSSRFNLPLEEVVELDERSKLIVLSRESS